MQPRTTGLDSMPTGSNPVALSWTWEFRLRIGVDPMVSILARANACQGLFRSPTYQASTSSGRSLPNTQ